MNPNMQGHNHGGKSHLFGMLGIGALVLVVLLGTGRSFQQALPLALFLACPLMMVGMMFMMRGGNGQHHGNDAPDQRAHEDATDRGTPKHLKHGRTRPTSPPLGPRRPPPCPDRLAQVRIGSCNFSFLEWVFSESSPEDSQDPHLPGGL